MDKKIESGLSMPSWMEDEDSYVDDGDDEELGFGEALANVIAVVVGLAGYALGRAWRSTVGRFF